jgi:hypothetical protein
MSSVGSAKTFVPKPSQTAEQQGVFHNSVIDDIKEEIFKRGPVVATFDIVYPTFFGVAGFEPSWFRNTWIDGIYLQVDSDMLTNYYDTTEGAVGGHAVAIVGWGEQVLNFNTVPGFLRGDNFQPDNQEYRRMLNVYKSLKGKSIPYWIVRNSWGTENIPNHTNGYFKIAMSNREIGYNLYPAIDVPKSKFRQTYGGITAMLPELSNEVVRNNPPTPSPTPDNNTTPSPTPSYHHATNVIASGTECGSPSGLLSSTSSDNKESSDKEDKKFYKKWWFIALVGIIILLIIFGLLKRKN